MDLVANRTSCSWFFILFSTFISIEPERGRSDRTRDRRREREREIRSEKGMEVKWLLKEKKFWAASFLIAWAAGLQGHMMWLQRQETFKQKFGTSNEFDIDGVDN